jgi:putative flavoprotein involved in K+ transport
MSTRADRDVIVVGAGLAGLACAAQLRHRGVDTEVLERGPVVATAWTRRYRALRLNSGRPFSTLPGHRFARGTPMFPSRDDMVAYLQSYAADTDLRVTTGTHVSHLEAENDRWRVRSPQGDRTARHVVVATGYLAVPVIPAWPGREGFRGHLVHASDYQTPGPFRGRDVVVVGGGSSGFDIAHDLAHHGAARVTLSVRSAPNIVLRSIGGQPGDPAILVLKHLPPSVADVQMRVLRRLTLPDLDDVGLPSPDIGPFGRLAIDGTAPAVVDREVVMSVCEGLVRVVPAVAELTPDGARLTSGEQVRADAVVAATGYRPGVTDMAGHLGVLDERGTPRSPAGAESRPGLRFVGFDPGPGLIPTMRRQSRRVARQIASALR